MVFAGIFPTDSAQYEDLRDALSKLHMNDAAFVFEPDTSEALGFGFRCGFLGLLHMEIIQERLEREYNLDLITTAPSVVYNCYLSDGTVKSIENPARLPAPNLIDHIEEPIFRMTIHVPATYVGAVLALCQERRGDQKSIQYASSDRVIITYDMPLSEVLFDFHDRLKSVSRGYASMDYELVGYRTDDLVRLDMLVNGEPLDALSVIVHREKAYARGRDLAVKLKDIVPRQQYEVAIQASLGSKVIARTTVKAMRKDVTAKCYGGDISRKRKLLEKQKEGKKRMKMVGSVEIPRKHSWLSLRSINGSHRWVLVRAHAGASSRQSGEVPAHREEKCRLLGEHTGRPAVHIVLRGEDGRLLGEDAFRRGGHGQLFAEPCQLLANHGSFRSTLSAPKSTLPIAGEGCQLPASARRPQRAQRRHLGKTLTS